MVMNGMPSLSSRPPPSQGGLLNRHDLRSAAALYRPPVLSDTFRPRDGALARQGRPALLRGRGSRHVRARRPPAAPPLAQDLVPRPLRPPQGDRVRDVVPAPEEGPRAGGAPRPCERDRARAPQSAVPDRDGRLSAHPRRVVVA